VFLGPLNEKYAHLPEISPREVFTLAPLALIVLLLGFYPVPVLGLFQSSVDHLVRVVWG
jgi:NADH:ubiquinone oxidoreductase subunit 4 (subunit M)